MESLPKLDPRPTTAVAKPPDDAPEVRLTALDTLWFQVTGTLCNLACRHCFISCSPTNHTHEMLSVEAIASHLAEGIQLGVREVYFTGGEPRSHPRRGLLRARARRRAASRRGGPRARAHRHGGAAGERQRGRARALSRAAAPRRRAPSAAQGPAALPAWRRGRARRRLCP